MPILLSLFLQFLKIGAFTFGGGYAMISIMRETVVESGWISEERFLDMIAVSESTPGPFAINMATFIGNEKAGILGAVLATLGVVLPSFVIILLIAAVFGRLLRYRGVQAFLHGVRPCVIGLILATGAALLITNLFAQGETGAITVDWRSAVIFALVAAAGFLFRKIKKKAPSPILLIGVSAGLGMLLYGIV